MKNSPICVDASFVVVYLTKRDSSGHLYWRPWNTEQRTIICPALLYFEVVNALHQYWRHDQLSSEIVQDYIRILYRLLIQIQTHPDLHARAALLAQQLKLGATYDAHYVALAQPWGAAL